VANYNIDIAVALKGAKELVKLKKDVKAVNQEIRGFNKALAENANKFPKTINKLAEEVNKAKVALRNAAVGTNTFTRAGEVLLKTQKALNKELSEEARILKQIETRRFGVAQSSSSNRVRRNVAESSRNRIDPKFKSLSLLGQTSPVGEKLERTLALKRDEIRLQESLLSLEQRSAAKQNEKLLIQGELNRQTAQAVSAAKVQALGGRGIGPGQAESVFKGRVLSNIAASQQMREIVAAGSNREKLGGGFKEFNKNAKKIQADTKKISTIVAQNQAQGIQAFGSQAYSQPIGPVRPGPLGRLGIGTGANPRGMFANSRGRGGRLSGALSSGLIGGGFPLLFGQGALGATGGGIGGAVGGALGGPFGFGLSIAGTAIAQRIAEGQEFEKQIDKVNKSILATGSSATFTSEDIKRLGKTLGLTKEEALKAAQSFKAFDAAMRTSLLVTFGDEATFNLIKGLKTNVQLINDIQEAEEIIGRERADQLLMMLRTEGSLKVQKKLQDEIIKVRENEKIGNKNKVNPFDRFMGFGRTLGNKYLNLFGQGPGAGNAEVTGEDIRDIRIDKILGENLEEKTAAVNQLGVEFERAMGLKLTNNIAAVRDELEMLMDPINQLTTLAETVGGAFGESFKGLIKGSMSAQQALANLFQRTADMFLDMAAQMIVKQIQMSILGIGFKFFGGNPYGVKEGQSLYDVKTPSRFTDRTVGVRANGGPVMKGGSYLVGERGPEMFSPGVSGMITPNEMLGGSTNIVVNVDASGSSVEGDEQQGRELGQLISVAIQSELIKQKRPGGLLG